MPMTAIETKVPVFNITIDSMPLSPNIAKHVTDISVTEQIDPPNSFSISISDPQMSLLKAYQGQISEGSMVEISLGYHNEMRKLIIGEISAISYDFSSSDGVNVRVEGYDLLHRLTRGVCYRRFDGSASGNALPDSDIVSLIAHEMELIPYVDPTPVLAIPRVQQNVSDFVFINELAQLNNYHIWIEGKKLYFKKTRPSRNRVKLEQGKNLLNFSRRISTAGLVNEFEVRGLDFQNQVISYKLSCLKDFRVLYPRGKQLIKIGAGGMSRVSVYNPKLSSEDEAQKYAKAMSARQIESILKGSGSAKGIPDIQVFTIVDLVGLGRFDGEYIVEKVSHTLNNSGYISAFELKAM